MKRKSFNLKDFTWVDLTHALSSEIPFWEDQCGFQHQVMKDYADSTTEVKFRVQKFDMLGGIGTHMDAPAHCIPDAKTIDAISLEQLIIPGSVIDVSSHSHENYQVTPDDIFKFEHKNGIIPKGSLVIFHTGWGKWWNQPKKYRNNLVFPSIAKETAKLLLDRHITGIGIDTLSPDLATSEFPVHQLMLEAGKYIIENVANVDRLPPVGSWVFVLPIKVQGGTEAPVRLVAMF